jgi:hypothetical protein
MASGDCNPFQELEKRFRQLSERQDKHTAANYENQNRMVCWALKDALGEYIDEIGRTSDADEVTRSAREYIGIVKRIVDRFRQLRNIIGSPKIHEENYSIFLLCDEYISRVVEENTYSLLETIKRRTLAEADEIRSALIGLIKDELQYRKENDYSVLPRDNKDRERLLYHRSVLARYMDSILYLNTRLKPEGKLFQELALSIAAGVAMIFATSVTFFAHAQYGNWTTTFFIVLVVSYMFKDRIKAQAQSFFSSRSEKFFFDYKTDIYTGSGRNVVGINRERFGFVDEKDVDKEILAVRNRDRLADIDSDYVGENIMLYKKRIGLYSNWFDKVYQGFSVEGINDIVRFDVTQFVRRMENSKKAFFVMQGDDYQKVIGRRVYHLNLVIRYRFDEGTLHDRFRIVISRNGIKRIEMRPLPASGETRQEGSLTAGYGGPHLALSGVRD